MIGYRMDWSSIPSREKEFSFTTMSIPAVVSVQVHNHWVLRAHPGGKAAGGAKLITEILMLVLRMCGTVPPVSVCFCNVMFN